MRKERLAIYTAVSGGYDQLAEPAYINPDCDYIAFTDDESLRSDFWEIRLMEDLDLDCSRKARRYKILPHLYLPEYERSLWIDANIHIAGDINEYINRYARDSAILCVAHPDRHCIYTEARACITFGKDYAAVIERQIERYKKEGFPEYQGLVASGILYRKHLDHRVVELMNDWYGEVARHSRRDQLSFNYVCWKHDFRYDRAPFHTVCDTYFRITKHAPRTTHDTRVQGKGSGMHRMWRSVMLPIIQGMNARHIVEVGSDKGLNTINILEYCAEHDARLTAIDPVPKFNLLECRAKYKERFEIHEELSVQRLPLLQDYDVVLLDGDHNWYTVYNELKIIENTFRGKKFPVIFLHDVGWPYARRDLYYNPQDVPAPYRQPHAQLGIHPGESALRERGGINGFLYNATHEHGPRNGVLTAVEDFIRESHGRLSFKRTGAFHGLGILYSAEDAALEEHIETVINESGLVDTLEEERVQLLATSDELKRRNQALHEKLEGMENRLKKTTSKLESANAQLARLNELRKENKTLHKELEGTKNCLKKTAGKLEGARSRVNELTAALYETEYNNEASRPIIQRLISRFPNIYLLLKTNGGGLKGSLMNIRAFREIKRKALLDLGFYLRNNADVRLAGVDPVLHYLVRGHKEGRKLTPSFDGDYYLQKHDDVKASGIDPLVHYALYGKTEGRKTRPIGKRQHAEETMGSEAPPRQDRDYHDFSGFLTHAFFSPIVFSPFREQDKRCFATMENIGKHLVRSTRATDPLPLVSVIVHIKDGAPEKAKSCIDSVLRQSYGALEIVVVAEEENAVRQLCASATDRNIVFIPKQQGNRTLCARNLGIAAARGEYVAYLDSGSIWETSYIETTVGAFIELPDAEAIYSGQFLLKGNESSPYALRYGTLNRSLLNNRNYIDLNSFSHKRAILETVGGFDERLERRHSDWDWIMRVAENAQMYSVPVALVRCHDDSPSPTPSVSDEALRAKQKERRERSQAAKKLDHKVSVIIPSYESLEDLRECIKSITGSVSPELLEIVVVDNASSAPVRDYLQGSAAEGRVKLILNDINYGFTHAVKQGIAIADPGNDLLILNNDAILERGAIAALQETAYAKSDCGLAVPQHILVGEGTKRSMPYADADFPIDTTGSRTYDNIINMPVFCSGRLLELNFAPFFCVYIRRSVYEASVGLDGELGRHARSDRIFCNYVRHVMKLKIYHSADAVVYHKVHTATRQLRDTESKRSDFDLMVLKNQWDEETAGKLGYKTAAIWDV